MEVKHETKNKKRKISNVNNNWNCMFCFNACNVYAIQSCKTDRFDGNRKHERNRIENRIINLEGTI